MVVAIGWDVTFAVTRAGAGSIGFCGYCNIVTDLIYVGVINMTRKESYSPRLQIVCIRRVYTKFQLQVTILGYTERKANPREKNARDC